MDMMMVFLNGTLSENIYMTQPPGYAKKEEHLVCKLKRSLYGLKQSPRCWIIVFKDHMESTGFKQSAADPCTFVRSKGSNLTIFAVYKDDLIIITKCS